MLDLEYVSGLLESSIKEVDIMTELTREQAIQLHVEMWTDMKNAGVSDNMHARYEFKEQWCKDHGIKLFNHCALCEYAYQQNDHSDICMCIFCPGHWESDDPGCMCVTNIEGKNWYDMYYDEIIHICDTEEGI